MFNHFFGYSDPIDETEGKTVFLQWWRYIPKMMAQTNRRLLVREVS